jgi:hypothetical protein
MVGATTVAVLFRAEMAVLVVVGIIFLTIQPDSQPLDKALSVVVAVVVLPAVGVVVLGK